VELGQYCQLPVLQASEFGLQLHDSASSAVSEAEPTCSI